MELNRDGLKIASIIALLLVAVGCEGVLECDICGAEHVTDQHVEATGGQGPIESGSSEMTDHVLLDFVRERRSEGFEKVNARPYPSDVSDSRINVFVSSFGVAEYLETEPTAEASAGMLPRGAFVVRELLDESGEVTKLTALYRGPKGYNPTSGDFWFAVTDPDGNPAKREDGSEMAGALASCSGCHAGRANADYLFGVPNDFRDRAFHHPGGEEEQQMPQQPEEPTVSLGGWQLINAEADLSRPQVGVLPAVDAEPGQIVVVAREATRAQFESVWGTLPADTVFINMGGAGSFGAPIVNGGETWQLVDAAGTVIDVDTPVGDSGHDYALETNGWTSGDIASATPGRTTYTGPTRITEWSDADDYHYEFVEIAIGN